MVTMVTKVEINFVMSIRFSIAHRILSQPPLYFYALVARLGTMLFEFFLPKMLRISPPGEVEKIYANGPPNWFPSLEDIVIILGTLAITITFFN